MIDLDNATVTNIQFFDCTREIQTGENEYETLKEYSANIIVNESLVIQLSGNEDESQAPSIPSSNECYYNNEELQDWAQENLDIDDVRSFLERCDISNNFYYLSDHGEAM